MAPIPASRTRRAPWRLLALWLGGLCSAFLGPAATTASSQAPPDLRLEWLLAARVTREAPPVRGEAGETVRLRYRLRNVGGEDAFAALLTAHTVLGPVGDPAHVRPAPEAGDHLDRHLDLPLAEGAREICLEVTLQSLGADDPGDPNPADNILCRQVVVEPDDGAGNGTGNES